MVVKNANGQKLLRTETAGYRPDPIGSGAMWGMPGAYGMFRLEQVEDMRKDPQVQLCLEYKAAPIYTAEVEINCQDNRVKEYLIEQKERFWKKSLSAALEDMAYGYSGSEALYTKKDGIYHFDYLKSFLWKDAKPRTWKGKLVCLRVGNIRSEPGTNPKTTKTNDQVSGAFVDLPTAGSSWPAKGLWYVHNGRTNPWYGRPLTVPMWFPWRMKNMPDGIMDDILKYAYKYSISCTVIRHPNEVYEGPDGNPVHSGDLARSMVELIKAGGVVALSSDRDEKGEYKYLIETWGEVQPGSEGLISIAEFYDKYIQRAAGIPDEVVTHQGNTGGYSRSQIAASAYLIGAERDLNYILETTDNQIWRPSVKLNFGNVPYTIKAKPLVLPDQQPGQGSPQQIQPPDKPPTQPNKPEALQFSIWEPYQGPQGGKGWKNTQTGDIVYQDNRPGEHQTSSESTGRNQGSADDKLSTLHWGEIVAHEATHTRVVGPTNSGKSLLAQAIAFNLEGRLIILDPVWVPGNWGGLPAITVSADGNYDPIKQALTELLDEMKKRGAELQKGKKDFERLNIIFDEVPDTITQVPEAGEFIRRIAQRGRHANMHLIGIAQSSRVGSWGLEGFGDAIENFCTILLGSKAIEVMPDLAGTDRPGVIEWRGKRYAIDMSEVPEMAKRTIPQDRLFKLPDVDMSAWESYSGPQGGRGWKRGDEIRYQLDQPDDNEFQSTQQQKSQAQPVTPSEQSKPKKIKTELNKESSLASKHREQVAKESKIEGTRVNTLGVSDIHLDPIASLSEEEIKKRYQENKPLPIPGKPDPQVESRLRSSWNEVSRIWPEAASALKNARMATPDEENQLRRAAGGGYATAAIQSKTGDLIIPYSTEEIPPEILWHELVHLEQLKHGVLTKEPRYDAKGMTEHGRRMESEAHQRGNMQAAAMLKTLHGENPYPDVKEAKDDSTGGWGSFSHCGTIEMSSGKHSYSSTQFDFPKGISDKIKEYIKEIPDSDLAEEGREDDIHITIKYGLHGNDPMRLREIIHGIHPITITLGCTSIFEHDDQDVLKIDIFGADIFNLNRLITESLANTETRPTYKPHLTLAYLKKGKGKKYANDDRFDGVKVTFDSLTFSPADGEKVDIPFRPSIIGQVSMSQENITFYSQLRKEIKELMDDDESNQYDDKEMSATATREPLTGGHWVTIGAHASKGKKEGEEGKKSDGEKHGGIHVYIKGDGTITKGPSNMLGKKPNELGHTITKHHEQKAPTPEAEKHPESKEHKPENIKPEKKKSKAKVKFDKDITSSDAKKAIADRLKLLFPKSRNIKESLASSIGAPDDAEVTIDRLEGQKGIKISVWHPKFRQTRTLSIDGEGKKYIHNDYFAVEKAFQNEGIGSEIFARQVEHSIDEGFSYIETHAAGQKGSRYNGYYTWPRFGYDESLEILQRSGSTLIVEEVRNKFPQAKSILDVMSTKEGRDWWKENGSDLEHAKFDLTEGSRSRKILSAYLEERKKGK